MVSLFLQKIYWKWNIYNNKENIEISFDEVILNFSNWIWKMIYESNEIWDQVHVVIFLVCVKESSIIFFLSIIRLIEQKSG